MLRGVEVPAGRSQISYRATLNVPDAVEDADENAPKLLPDQLPDDVLIDRMIPGSRSAPF